MAREYMDFDTTPTEEGCAMVGDPHYPIKVREEFRRIVELLRKKFGPEPAGVDFKLQANPHDFGTYHELRVFYNDADPLCVGYVIAIEGYFPKTWDDDSPIPIPKGWPEQTGSIFDNNNRRD